jgi:hypothetical protein
MDNLESSAMFRSVYGEQVEFCVTGFHVIDKTTGEEPDTYNIALHEDWAKGLIYCDIDGFWFSEDGQLILMDDCCNVAYCPPDRFEVVWEVAQKAPLARRG